MTASPPDRPRLRPIEAFLVEREGSSVYCLRDPSGDSEEVLFLSEAALWIARRLDGTRDAGDLQTDICRMSGSIVAREAISGLIDRLEEAGFLDSPSMRERIAAQERAFAAAPSRLAAHAGLSYDLDPTSLGLWIDQLVGAGEIPAEGRPIRALIAPHIDPRRGASVYGSAYRSIRNSQAERIVILGISHNGGSLPFATLSKDFETPFGGCPADRDFLARLAAGLPFDPQREQLLHRREHSIEFQLVFLRHILDGWETRRIVPILCCFPWCADDRPDSIPYPSEWIEIFIERLAESIDSSSLLIAGVDFAHVGLRFGDTETGADRRDEIERADRAMMERIAAGDVTAFRAGIEQEKDARRICGYPAIRTMLESLPGLNGTVLDYGQAVERETGSLVSFGAIGFF